MIIAIAIFIFITTVKTANSELLTTYDIKYIFDHLEKAIAYYYRNRNIIDSTLFFGSYVCELQMKVTTETYYGRLKYWESEIYFKCLSLIRTLMHINNYFQVRVEEDRNPKNRKEKNITRLFTDTRVWLAGLHLMGITTFNHVPLNTSLPKFENYTEKVYEWKYMSPSPSESDKCIHEIINHTYTFPYNVFKYCEVSHDCMRMLINGSNYGWAITHRVLWYFIANYGRPCYFEYYSKDYYTTDKLCAEIMDESRFIVLNKFDKLELLTEQIALCSLVRHAEFLEKTWIDKILQLQTPEGCFKAAHPDFGGVKVSTGRQFIVTQRDFDINKGRCNRHVTAMATIMLSTSMRWIAGRYWYLG